jgi:DNA repair protein RecO (recombination protein O)
MQASSLGLVLHAIAWRETSLIVEVFTRDHGRLGLVARGARRPRSALRGLLQPFQPLDLRWSGKSELRNLIGAEWVGGLPGLSGASIMPGFYLNELMVKLLPREDAHPNLFDDYLATLGLLGRHPDDVSLTEPVLRRFECNLLREMGYAPRFDCETVSLQPIDPSLRYEVSPVSGIRRVTDHDDAAGFQGKTLAALAQAGRSIEEAVEALEPSEIAIESKRILRLLLGHHLGEDDLQSRHVMRELVRI